MGFVALAFICRVLLSVCETYAYVDMRRLFKLGNEMVSYMYERMCECKFQKTYKSCFKLKLYILIIIFLKLNLIFLYLNLFSNQEMG